MSFRLSKEKKRPRDTKLFERAACDERLAQTLSAKFRGVSKVANLIPYLLEDDRIACQYADKSAPAGFKLLPGGYFRFYNPDEGMIYLSPFKRPMQLALLEAFGKKIQYHKWAVGSINVMYIRESTEERIRQIRAGAARPQPRSFPIQRPEPIQRMASESQIGERGARPSSMPPSFAIHVRNAPIGYSPGR